MNTNVLADHLRTLGFTDEDYKLTGCEKVNGCVDLYRLHQGQHQYVALTTYLDVFCEAVVRVYALPFKSRQKPQQDPLFRNLCRSQDTMVEAVSKVYDLPKKS